MIITGTTSATWNKSIGGVIPSVIFEGRELVQRAGAAMDNPLYPLRANGNYNSGSVKLFTLPSLWKITAEDLKDTYDSQSGEYIRQVGQTAFDGTETWIYSATYHYFRIQMLDMATLDHNMNCACSHGVPITSFSQIGVRFGVNNKWVYFYVGADSPLTSVALFKQWLADQAANGTPVTIYYPLAATTTTTETAQPITASWGTGIIALTSGTAVNFTANVKTLDEIPLITDRSAFDITPYADLRQKIINRTATQDEWDEWNAGMRNAYNYIDLNRCGVYLEYIEQTFEDEPLTLTAKQDWARGIPSYTDMVNFVNDIIAVRNTVPVPADTPTIKPFGLYGLTDGLNNMKQTTANNIEKILEAAINYIEG